MINRPFTRQQSDTVYTPVLITINRYRLHTSSHYNKQIPFTRQCSLQQSDIVYTPALITIKRRFVIAGEVPFTRQHAIIKIEWRPMMVSVSQRTRDAITTSLLRRNDVSTSFRRNYDVIIASCDTGTRLFQYPE